MNEPFTPPPPQHFSLPVLQRYTNLLGQGLDLCPLDVLIQAVCLLVFCHLQRHQAGQTPLLASYPSGWCYPSPSQHVCQLATPLAQHRRDKGPQSAEVTVQGQGQEKKILRRVKLEPRDSKRSESQGSAVTTQLHWTERHNVLSVAGCFGYFHIGMVLLYQKRLFLSKIWWIRFYEKLNDFSKYRVFETLLYVPFYDWRIIKWRASH